ncbi:uncharacterized protein TNCV_916211 [Trichonephila clavipes]|nr:uncharacterized protein TNCV_916211 [Trichonephila clavipes]
MMRVHSAMFQSSLRIRLNCFLDQLVLPIYLQSKMCSRCLHNDWPGIYPPTATQGELWQYVKAAWTDVPQGYIQSLFDSEPRHVAAVIANNGVYTNY